MEIVVTDHAYWRAAERFPGFLTETIEAEVMEAIRVGRVATDRRELGLSAGSDPDCLYVCSPGCERVYAILSEPHAFIVLTVMRPRQRPAALLESGLHESRRRAPTEGRAR